MHILHISADFSNTKVHANLYKQLDLMGIEQTIFNPIRKEKRNTIGSNEFDAGHTHFVYAHVIKPFHHYAYHIKRQAIFKALQNQVDLKSIDLVHATSLFTDGGQAYMIYKKYRIPYFVAVRTTDINGFLEQLPNTWIAGKKILKNAQKIFFISKALMVRFANHKVIRPILPDIEHKMMLIPNGIDDYFLNRICREQHSGHQVLYVGDFSSNKNVTRLGDAVLLLRKEFGFEDVTLTLVGGGKASDYSIQTMIDNHPEALRYLGPIYDKEKLCEVFRSHSLFAMTSFNETFGLVYVEALSQNLPVVYTKGQGIDGLFDESVGIGVNPISVDEIKSAIKTILSSPERFSNGTVDFEEFRWSKVAEKYKSFYDLFEREGVFGNEYVNTN